MGKPNDRKERLAAKQKRDVDKKTGGNFRVLDMTDHPDVTWVKPELDVDYAFDIMPYKVTSKKHPEYEALKEDDWMEDYKLDLYVHKSVGPSNKNMVCPNKNYGKACPICEEHDRLKEEEGLDWKDDKLYALRPKNRSFFNVIDLEDKSTLKIFEHSYGWFTKNLLAQIKRKSKKREYLLGDISEDGVTIEFQFEKSTYNGKTFPGEVKSFSFEERDTGYTDEDIENAPKLDTMVKLSTYEEISNVFFGEEDSEDSDDSKDTSDEASKEEPEKKSSRREHSKEKEEETEPVCPADLTFGEDIDVKGCLEDCKFYDECDKKYEETHK